MQKVPKNQTLTPLEVSTLLEPLQSESFLPFLLQVLEVVWATTEKRYGSCLSLWMLTSTTTKQQKIDETAPCRMLNVTYLTSYVMCRFFAVCWLDGRHVFKVPNGRDIDSQLGSKQTWTFQSPFFSVQSITVHNIASNQSFASLYNSYITHINQSFKGRANNAQIFHIWKPFQQVLL